jgi:hypothetical protein
MSLPKRSSCRPSVEILEDRRVPTTANLSLGLLNVTGTVGDDLIIIKRVLGRIHVRGVAGSFKAADVNQISADGLDGQDRIEIRPTVPRRITTTVRRPGQRYSVWRRRQRQHRRRRWR